MTGRGSVAGDRSWTAVVAAMAEEIAPLRRRLCVEGRQRVGACRMVHGILGGSRVVLATTGDGRARAERGLEALVGRYSLDRLLVIGISGGLSPGLEPAALVVAGEVRSAPGAGIGPPDAAWRERALALEGALDGTAISADRLLCTAAEKSAAFQDAGGTGLAAVDVESATFARVATRHGLPYLVVRAICDPADEDLPLDLNRYLDPAGKVDRLRVAAHALRHPRLMGPLWRLRRRVARCGERLAPFVDELLNTQAA